MNEHKMFDSMRPGEIHKKSMSGKIRMQSNTGYIQMECVISVNAWICNMHELSKQMLNLQSLKNPIDSDKSEKNERYRTEFFSALFTEREYFTMPNKLIWHEGLISKLIGKIKPSFEYYSWVR